MITDEKLCILNNQGFIPGPDENLEFFLKRVEATKKLSKDPIFFFKEINQTVPIELDLKIKKPRWNWTRAQLLNLFDFSPINLAMFYSDKKLTFFQAAATWILEIGKNLKVPILQFRKKLHRSTYLKIYSLDEILAHEAVHAARVAFDEPKYEEIFAYMTSTSVIRRVLGPIVKNTKDIILFFSNLFFYLLFQIFWVITSYNPFMYVSFVFGIMMISFLSFGLFRLFFAKLKMKKTFNKLYGILKNKNKARAVLFRLTDKEIDNLSKLKKEEFLSYFMKNKKKSIRLKVLVLAYFAFV
ncbi:MAG: hypothetical protein K1060chlam5_00721 [Candidatus Anoxychlamydiales bacterium]|nr:hypothetical protein [Candidatus Anoxychlamydiales bacterium]